MNLFNFFRIGKSIIFRSKIAKFIPINTLELIAQMSKLSLWIQRHNNIPFNDYPMKKFTYSNRTKLYKYLIKSQNINSNIDYLEFGVSRGASFKWWIDNLTDESVRFYGFDTFSGLPEDWGLFKKGDMHNDDNLPIIEDDDRHKFYKGLFQDTLIDFLKDYKPQKRRIIHMDADIYSATLYVLTIIRPYLRSGDLVLFDEFNVPMHEFKAFTEWCSICYVDCELLGAVNNYYQVAFKIK